MLCFLFLIITFLSLFSSSASLPNSYSFRNNFLQSSTSKLSLADSAEWTEYNIREPEGPGTYSFGYDVEDSQTGTVQFRTEERRPNGTVTGSYGYVTPEGSVHVVHYVADHLGYRTKIEDVQRYKTPNSYYNSVKKTPENISPQMQAALQSLGNYNRNQREDQRYRPIDKVNSNGFNTIPSQIKENHQEKNNNIYKVYFVPPH